jgi:hypothetical protein
VVRQLLDAAGASLRGFEGRHGIDHSRVSYYKNGQRMPPLEFMEALVRDARTYAGLTDEDARQAFCAYRAALAQLGTPDGSDQNSLLLRIYDLTQQLTEINTELQTVREGTSEVPAGEHRQSAADVTEPDELNESDADDESAVGFERRPQQRGEELAALRRDLLNQRGTVRTELTRCQSQWLELEPPAEGSVADGQHLRLRKRRRILFAVAAVTAAALAAVTFFLLPTDRPAHVVTDSDGKTTRTPSSQPTPTTTEASPSTSPSLAKPSPTETARKEVPPARRDKVTGVPDNTGGGSSAGSAGKTDGSSVASPTPTCAGGGGLFGGADGTDCPSSNPTPTPSPTPTDGSGGIFGGTDGG